MSNSTHTLDVIKTEANNLGFPLFGVTSSKIPEHLAGYRSWVGQGHAADMAYLIHESSIFKRQSIDNFFPGCKSIICLGYLYTIELNPNKEVHSAPHGKIAGFALLPDYHDVLKEKLQIICDLLDKHFYRDLKYRICVDTSPLLEREYACRAGLGWIGKNSNLISPKYGSTFLIGEILLNQELPESKVFQADRCGNCHRCIDACPTKCIQPNRTIDSCRCISYLTIENRNQIPIDLRKKVGNWILGCDICQSVCPWNQKNNQLKANQSLLQIKYPNLISELLLSKSEFAKKYKNSSILRAKRDGYIRNILCAIGNSNNPTAVKDLIRFQEVETNPILLEICTWSLKQLQINA